MASSAAPEPKYPDYRHAAEARRLRVQGTLVTAALGGHALLCPLDTSRPNLRVLDCATADGHFLTVVRGLLAHPDSAELVGADIAPFPPLPGMPANVRMETQDLTKPWPPAWQGSFDFVHQRAALSVSGSMDGAVASVGRLVALLKPGGWIQIVDGGMDLEPLRADDKPSEKLFKVIVTSLKTRAGVDSTLGISAGEILARAGQGQLQDLETKKGVSRLGKGAATEELQEMGYEQLQGCMLRAWHFTKGTPEDERLVSLEDMEALLPELMKEAREQGVDMTWYAAWAQKVHPSHS